MVSKKSQRKMVRKAKVKDAKLMASAKKRVQANQQHASTMKSRQSGTVAKLRNEDRKRMRAAKKRLGG